MYKRAILLALLLLALLASRPLAGDLADFESGATSGGSSGDSASLSSSSDGDGDGFMLSPADGCGQGGQPECDKRPAGRISVDRSDGELFLPFTAIDLAFQSVRPDITALDGHFEMGYGPLAFSARFTRFEEKHPSDTLDAVSAHLLLRLRPVEWLQLSPGLGTFTLDGDKTNTGTSVTMPVLIRLNGSWAAEFRPQWAEIKGNSIEDYDLSAIWGEKSWYLRAGYRWLISPGKTLDGPYLGVSYRY